MKYRVTFPFIPDMGTVQPMIATSSSQETKEQNALWHINRMRDHDGLRHMQYLPAGTTFEPIYE